MGRMGSWGGWLAAALATAAAAMAPSRAAVLLRLARAALRMALAAALCGAAEAAAQAGALEWQRYRYCCCTVSAWAWRHTPAACCRCLAAGRLWRRSGPTCRHAAPSWARASQARTPSPMRCACPPASCASHLTPAYPCLLRHARLQESLTVRPPACRVPYRAHASASRRTPAQAHSLLPGTCPCCPLLQPEPAPRCARIPALRGGSALHLLRGIAIGIARQRTRHLLPRRELILFPPAPPCVPRLLRVWPQRLARRGRRRDATWWRTAGVLRRLPPPPSFRSNPFSSHHISSYRIVSCCSV